jgi:hypothetical protein
LENELSLSAVKNKNVFMLKANEIKKLFHRFEEAAVEYDGVGCWSARECHREGEEMFSTDLPWLCRILPSHSGLPPHI